MLLPESSVGSFLLQCRRPQFNPWVGTICWRRDRLPTPIFLGFLCGSAGKESACDVGDLGSTQESTCNAGDLGLITGLERSPGEGKGYPLQYSGLESSMNYIVHRVAKSWTQAHFAFTFMLSRPDHFLSLLDFCLFIFFIC